MKLRKWEAPAEEWALLFQTRDLMSSDKEKKPYDWGPLSGHSSRRQPSVSLWVRHHLWPDDEALSLPGKDRPQEVKWISQHYTANINRWGAEGGGGELGFENSGLLCSQVHFLCLIPWSPQRCGRASNGRLISSSFSKCRSVLFVLGVERRSEWQRYREGHLCHYIHTSHPHFP